MPEECDEGRGGVSYQSYMILPEGGEIPQAPLRSLAEVQNIDEIGSKPLSRPYSYILSKHSQHEPLSGNFHLMTLCFLFLYVSIKPSLAS